jgi:TPR repeat protein
MNSKRTLWALAAAAALGAGAAPLLAQSVESGITAWQAGDYDAAVRAWRPLADRGDEDAQFNLGHAYRLGRGVPRNMQLAEQWYERAARAGHLEAQAMYGLILFQNGRRQEAMPFVQRAATRGRNMSTAPLCSTAIPSSATGRGPMPI